MIGLRTTISAAVVALMAMAGSPASANLSVDYCLGAGCTSMTNLTTGGTQITGFSAFNIGGSQFSITTLNVFGQGSAFCNISGCLMNNNNTDLTSAGSGSISILITETGVTEGSLSQLQAAMAGNLGGAGASSNLSDTRSFFINYTSGETAGACGSESNCLATDSGTCSGTNVCAESYNKHNIAVPTGTFSLTEEITFGASGAGGSLGNIDALDQQIPEPVSLSIFGTGLVALGAFTRRRKNKRAA